MEVFPKEAVGAVATIVAAIVAGIVGLLGLIISKEQKVSEFRQQWIDALRADIAEVIKYGACLHPVVISKVDLSSFKEDLAGISAANARINLRLNSKDKESADLLRCLVTYIELVNKHPGEHSTVIRTTEALVVAANVVLKQEWHRVRAGEPVYKVAK